MKDQKATAEDAEDADKRWLRLSASSASSAVAFVRSRGDRMKKLLILATAVGCGRADAAQKPQQQQWGASAPFVQHPEHIQPGMTLSRQFMAVTNPYDGDAARA